MNEQVRLFKRLTYAFIIFAIIGTFGLLVYFKSFTPSQCFNGSKDFDEEEIDCGGPCAPCSGDIIPAGAVNFKQNGVTVVPVGSNSYDLVANIENPNSNWGAQYLSYKFSLYNKDNKLITTAEGKDYIEPADKSKYIIKHIDDIREKPQSAKLDLSSIVWKDLPTFIPKPKFNILYKTFNADSPNNIYADGTLENTSHYGLNTVYVRVIVTNGTNEIIGAAYTTLDTVDAGEKRYFKVEFGNIVKDKSTNVNANFYVETNVLDPDNFMRKSYPEPTNFQP